MSNQLSDSPLANPPLTGVAAELHTLPPRTPSPNDARGLTSNHPSESTPSQAGLDASGLNNANNRTLGVPAQLFLPNDASPVGKKSYHDSGQFASIQTPNVIKRRRDVRLSMTGKIILLSFDEFMDRFVPAPEGETEPTERFATADFSAIPNKQESRMYDPMKAAFNQDWLLPHDVAVSTPNKGDGNVASNQKIDGGLYPRAEAPQDSTRWSSIELSIECKTEPTQQDPFDDGSAWPEPSSIMRKDVLGQIMCYAVLVFDNQHRTHHFTLLLLGAMARIIRWDRSGLLATHKFDYTKKPQYLALFLWRFGRLTPEQRGHDSTAERILPGSATYKLMHARAATPMKAGDGSAIGEHARELFKDSLFIKAPAKDDSTKTVVLGPAPLWRLTVHDSRGCRTFLVGLPHTTAGTLAGRGTRTYVALDEGDKDGPLVYLKDAWRVAHDRMEQEGKILELLNDDSGGGPVNGVPTLHCHGDVEGQVTLSQSVWRDKNPDAKPEDSPFKTHNHYRLVVKEVCLPMREFVSFHELLVLIAICIRAHGQAFTRKGILHRDISAGNVLIYPKEVIANGTVTVKRVALLADWELAKTVTETEDGPRQPDRTGTWQFTSAMALANPSKRIVIQDDMESFFHLILYFAIRFLPHNCENVGEFMDAYFDGHLQANGRYYGGKEKLAAMLEGRVTTLLYAPLSFYVPQQPDTSPLAHRNTGNVAPTTNFQSPKPAYTNCADNSSNGPSGYPSSEQCTDTVMKPHPINAVFVDYLKRIKAYYALHYSPTNEFKSGSTHADGLVSNSEHLESVLEASESLLLSEFAAEAPEATLTADSQAPKVAFRTEKEKAELEATAAPLGSHEEMVRLLLRHLQAKNTWPKHADRIPDQLPRNYQRGMDTAFGTKRTLESVQTATPEPPSKRARSLR
ncbi:hypothetical protein PYCCODRAFT_1469576 [Trametes coccinea BRFM310]|uniref:Fungal-type protein kinase domain-containing protein n=1 Tax=Trametes coccinea (strain BRFM310) TaxID=1353009 RepID=A0A1Y2IGG6_TRAC3|nr:hypothetical protein PYCCODRAFT_1469576 [Trametes coccinea BRFM310]